MSKKIIVLGVILSFCIGFLLAQTTVTPSASDTSFVNPWLIAIIGGVIGAVISGIILYFIFEHQKLLDLKRIRTISLKKCRSIARE